MGFLSWHHCMSHSTEENCSFESLGQKFRVQRSPSVDPSSAQGICSATNCSFWNRKMIHFTVNKKKKMKDQQPFLHSHFSPSLSLNWEVHLLLNSTRVPTEQLNFIPQPHIRQFWTVRFVCAVASMQSARRPLCFSTLTFALGVEFSCEDQCLRLPRDCTQRRRQTRNPLL